MTAANAVARVHRDVMAAGAIVAPVKAVAADQMARKAERVDHVAKDRDNADLIRAEIVSDEMIGATNILSHAKHRNRCRRSWRASFRTKKASNHSRARSR